MKIKGLKVTIRAIEAQDLEQLNVWANDPDTQYLIGGWHFPTSLRDQHRWFESLSVSSHDQRFIIEDENGNSIGTCNLVKINWKDRNAECGLMLFGPARGKQYGIDVVFAIMRYAFEELGLNRLETTIIEYNAPSIALFLKKAGWKEEGRQRKWYFRKNRFWDRLLLAILKEEYLLIKDNYFKRTLN